MGDAPDFLKFLRDSIFKDDFIILIWFIFTSIIAGLAYINSKKVKKALETPSEKISNRLLRNHKSMGISDIQNKEDDLQKKRRRQTFFYTLYINAISIFPLLGMLGTVKSLVELSSGMSDNGMVMEQFFKALSSTAWGMIFAILFKAFVDPLITSQVTLNENEIELFLNRVSIMRDEALKEESKKAEAKIE